MKNEVGIWNSAGGEQTWFAVVVTVGMATVVGSALAFEHIGGYAPCALCLEQRNPYYWGIPIIAIGSLGGLLKWNPCIVRGALMIAFLCLVTTALMGAYHAGVEWGFWPGPESCSAGVTGGESDAGSLLNDLANAKPPSCVDAAGRFLGLSFAGWNVIAASALSIFAFKGAFDRV